MIIKGSYTNYGEAIGIIMLDTKFPRPVGDVGNALTFPFPVRYKTVRGATPRGAVIDKDPAYLEPFISAAQELVAEGVKAITTSCGFLAMYQKEMAASVDVPVFTSSLLQVPFAYSLVGKQGKIGILTARRESLTERHYQGAGMKNIPVAVAGMDDMDEFTKVFIENKEELDFARCRQEIQKIAGELVANNPDIKAIVMECTNLPPFRDAVRCVTQRPVFDIVTLTNYLYSSLL